MTDQPDRDRPREPTDGTTVGVDPGLDRRLTEAFGAFDRIAVAEPVLFLRDPVGRGRRTVALGAACAAILTAGVIALAVTGLDSESATSPLLTGSVPDETATDDEPSGRDELPDPVPPTTPTSSQAPHVSGTPHRCDGFLGLDGEARLYLDCGPEMEFGIVDYRCTGFAGTDDTGRDLLADCEPIVPASPSMPPGHWAAASSGTYEVQAGDDPLLVAEMFCVSLDDLISFNRWTSEAEFPFPGLEIRIPPGSCSPAPIDGG
ncbi:MAG: hypothetical protein AAGG08_01465 [Actinomycetota bacterium]